MSKANYLTTYPTSHALGSVILVVFLGALLGIFGQIAQSLAPYLAILLALIRVRVFIGTSVWLLNRVCRHCRESLSAASDNDVTVCDVDPEAERLKSAVDTKRCEEATCAALYSRRRCSSDDIIRAKSLRVQAEIELLRYTAMPKPWAEACGTFFREHD